ncbi:MAG: flagellin [Selenomonadaceae bacterium]|nr:flagellin [Selenomonadaceae bacterium]
MEAAASFEANKANAQAKLDDYNSKMEQLGALTLEDQFYDARGNYEDSVDSYLLNLQKSATGNTSDSFSYIDSNGVTQTSAQLDKGRNEFVKNMIDDLRSQLLAVDPGNGKNNANATKILNNVKINGGAVSKADVNTYSALQGADTKVGQDATKVDTAQGALDGVAGVLDKAHSDAFKTYSGPQLVTGSNIGTDAAGKMISTASGENALTIAAANSGVGGQIAGFTIGIKDAQGNARKSAEAALDAFDESIRGKNASADNSVNLQIGTKANMTITVGMTDMRSQALGLKGSDGSTLNIGNRENANAAINVLDNALAKVLDQATTIGAVQSRLEYTSSNLTTSAENVTASESTIRDADMAKEMTEYTKNNVLLQAAQSMLSQANQNSSAVLSLLQ